MMPIMILPQEAMSKEDIEILRANGICVVVAKEPHAVKFVDPIPAASSRTEIEQASLSLSRKLLHPGFWRRDSFTADDSSLRKTITASFVELLLNGTPLDSKPTKEELQKEAYHAEKIREMQLLAREDAKAERQASKAKLASQSYEDKKKALGIAVQKDAEGKAD